MASARFFTPLEDFSMTKIETKKSNTGAAKAFAVAVLSLWSLLMPTTIVFAEEDRPVIKVPRGGGRESFTTNCVLCHKYDGRGGPSEGGYGADLRVTALTHEELIEVITNGRAGKGMPPFKGIVDDETIETLAYFIKKDLKPTQ
jgi:mono/diheme cytochrome c family protein